MEDTDLLLIEREGTSYKIETQDMSNLKDTDLLLVERDGVSYKMTADQIDTGPTGSMGKPVSVLTPLNGAGLNEGEPYQPLSTAITAVGTSGQASYSTDLITTVDAYSLWNQDENWPSGGQNDMRSPWSNAFDGNLTTGATPNVNRTQSCVFGNIICDKLEFYTNNSGGTVKLHNNDADVTSVLVNNEWADVTEFLPSDKTFSGVTLSTPSGGPQPALIAIKANGLILVSSQSSETPPTAPKLLFLNNNNFDKFEVGDVVQTGDWNQSQEWSNHLISEGNWEQPPALAFDGDTATAASLGNGSYGIMFDISNNPIPINSKVTLIGYGNYEPRQVVVNGNSTASTTIANGPVVTTDLNLAGETELKTLTISGPFGINALYVDDILLADATVYNPDAVLITEITGTGVPNIKVNGGSWLGADGSGEAGGETVVMKTVAYETSLTFTDATELVNMVGPLTMVGADGTLVVPVSSQVVATNPEPIYPAQSFSTQMATGTISGDGKTGVGDNYEDLFNNNSSNNWQMFGTGSGYGFNGGYRFYLDSPILVNSSVGVTAQNSDRCHGGAYFFFTDGSQAFCDYNRNIYNTDKVTITTAVSGPKYVESIQFMISSGADGGSQRMSYWDLILDGNLLLDMVPGPADYTKMNFGFPNPDLEFFKPGDDVAKPILRPADNEWAVPPDFTTANSQNIFDGDINTLAEFTHASLTSGNVRGPEWKFNDTPVILALDETILTRVDTPYNGTKGKWCYYKTTGDTNPQASNFTRKPVGQSGTWVSVTGNEIFNDNVITSFSSYINITAANQKKEAGSVVVCDSSSLEIKYIVSNLSEVPDTAPCEVVDVNVLANTMTVNSDVYEVGDTVTGPPLVASANDVTFQEGNVLGVSDVSGTWFPGLYAQGAEITAYAPSPESVVFTSMNAGTTPFTGTDASLVSRTWTLEKGNSSSGPWTEVGVYIDFAANESQDGATPWNNPALEANKFYQVKVQYDSNNADSVESTFNTFKTGDA